MGRLAMDRSETTFAQRVVTDELARGDRALRAIAPVIAHFLRGEGSTMVSDAIVARLRGMIGDLARQLLAAASGDESLVDQLADDLAGEAALVDHLHALAIEAQLAERLERRGAIDPILSPLLQELIASDRPATAELAMNVLAAQSRFCDSQRRMQLAIGELPPELFGRVVECLGRADTVLDPEAVADGVAALKRDYDEASARIGLLSRLVSSLRGGAIAALDLDHAGLALFASALGQLTHQDRDLAVLACHESQAVRFALGLRAAGASAEAIERQLALLGGTSEVPGGVAMMPVEQAQDLLAAHRAVDQSDEGVAPA
jgi:hypothetical protein